MQKIIRKPQFFFFFLALLFFIFSLLNKNGTIPIAIDYANIDIQVWSLGLISAAFFVLIAVNYTSLSITQKTPKKVLTIIHIVLQIISIIPVLYLMIQSNVPETYDGISQMNAILILAFFVFLTATLIHLINFVVSLIAKKD